MSAEFDNYYRCKKCYKIIIESDLREHLHMHYPGLPQRLEAAELITSFKFYRKALRSHTPVQYTKSTQITTFPPVKKWNIQTNSKYICYKPVNVLPSPKTREAKDLFEYAVKRIAYFLQSDHEVLTPKTHQQWAGYCFDRKVIQAALIGDYMSKIKDVYKEFFKRSTGMKYTFDFEKISKLYPDFFASTHSDEPKPKGISAMITALQNEIYLSKQPDKRDKYRVLDIIMVDSKKDLYALSLDIDDSKNVSFNETTKASLCIEDHWYNCDCIDYDEDNCILYVRSNKTIIGKKGILFVDAVFILEKELEKLKIIENNPLVEGQPAIKFLKKQTRNISKLSLFKNFNKEKLLKGLDHRQSRAIDHVLNNDISFIWGPPGTGKSFTLSKLINLLHAIDEKTLVCCISNVAVDQLLNKVLDELERLKVSPNNGIFMRAGYTTDSRILSKDFLFPQDQILDNMRLRLRKINDEINQLSKGSKSKTNELKELHLKDERLELREDIKKRSEEIIDKAHVIFSTIANYIVSSKLENKHFDNLIVDEASMLSMPTLMSIAKNVFKRVILVGDPNQLGPISLNPDEILSKSVFYHCEVLHSHHPGLIRLLNQRRSHRSIVNLTNEFFYDGQLIAEIEASPQWVFKNPFPGLVIKVINSDIEDDKVKMIGTSRRNFGTFNKIMDILEECSITLKSTISIGVITPFRAQVRMYRKAINEHIKLYGNAFWGEIKVGTVHTFQGSECDLIFFDLVEKSPEKVSKLLNDKDGERLINVALSRPRHKLIVVGDTKRFNNGTGLINVSNTTCKVLYRLSDVSAKK